MHWIDTYIVDKLIHHKFRRNRDLRPVNVESNLFQYHLKQMLKDKYAAKCPDGTYELGVKGLALADSYSAELKTQRPQSKVITVILVKDESGNVLLERKAKQPFIGQLQLPAGKVHLGETWDEAAMRELEEKQNLSNIKLTRNGISHIVIRNGETIIQDYIAVRYSTQVKSHRPSDITCPTEKLPADVAPGIQEIVSGFVSGGNSEHIIDC
jgi:NUDIX domain